jgi:acetyltransferase-like isoleucine patch superfamily enzyme
MLSGKDFARSIFLFGSWTMHLLHLLLNLLPPPLRNIFFRIIMRKMGRAVFIDYGTYFRFPWRVELGDGVTINRNCSFYPSLHSKAAFIKIGDNVRIGPAVEFFSGSHDHSGIDLPDIGDSIIVEDNVWIGGRSVILPGVVLHEGCVIGAGSVVTKSVPPRMVAAGSPARVIKKREIRNL